MRRVSNCKGTVTRVPLICGDYTGDMRCKITWVVMCMFIYQWSFILSGSNCLYSLDHEHTVNTSLIMITFICKPVSCLQVSSLNYCSTNKYMHSTRFRTCIYYCYTRDLFRSLLKRRFMLDINFVQVKKCSI